MIRPVLAIYTDPVPPMPPKAWLSQQKAVKRSRRMGYRYLVGLVTFAIASYHLLPLLITLAGVVFGIILVGVSFYDAQKIRSIPPDEWLRRVGEQ